MPQSLRKTAWAAFVAALFLLLVMAALAYQTTRLLVGSEGWVEHTREVQETLEDLCSDSLSANNARRGFVITGDAAMAQTYERAAARIPQRLARLRQLVSDNPARLHEIDELDAVLQQHLGLLRDSLTLGGSPEARARQQIEITQESARLSTQVRQLVDRMKGEEEQLLGQRQARSRQIYYHTLILIAAAFAIALGLLAAEFYLFDQQFRKRMLSESAARRIGDLVNAFFSSSNVGFGILDSDLRYRRVNATLARMVGRPPEEFPGKQAREILGDGFSKAESVQESLVHNGQAVLDGEVTSHASPNSEDLQQQWLVNYFPIRDRQNEVHEVGVIALDVTARRQAEKALRRLSARLINLQDEERRRIARDIHDGLGQYLVALKLMVEMLRNTSPEAVPAAHAECVEVLDKCISETRTLSHLLHPPLLDQAGFTSAAGWFVSGFSKRSGIPVNLQIPPDFPRLSYPAEIALFRALQEGLTNIHRHSQSSSAEIRLESDAEVVTLEVQDHGRGLPEEVAKRLREGDTPGGVGLAGMKERVNELGGQFEIQSNGTGTLVRITLPLVAYPAAATPPEIPIA